MALSDFFITTSVSAKKFLQHRRKYSHSGKMEIQHARVEVKGSLGKQSQNMRAHLFRIDWFSIGGQAHDDVLIVIRAESQKGRHGGIELSQRVRKRNALQHANLRAFANRE